MKNASAAPAPPRWYYRPWGVLLLLFVVLGPLGLPFLWRSPSFTPRWKVALTVATAAYTVLLVQSTVAAVQMAMAQIRPA